MSNKKLISRLDCLDRISFTFVVWFHEKSNLSVVVNVTNVDGPVRVGYENYLKKINFFSIADTALKKNWVQR